MRRRFDSRVGQVGYTVANRSPPLREFFKLEAELPIRNATEVGLATRYTSLRKTASTVLYNRDFNC